MTGGKRPASPGSVTPRRRRLRKQRRRAQARRRRNLLLALAALVVLVIAALVAGGIGGAVAFRSSCSLSSLHPVAIGQNSFVYAADGSLLGSIPAERNRQAVSLANVSPWMRKATVAIEDRRFYKHGGVDYEGILRAAVRDLRAGRIVEGGSTITQQLVRNLYISRERTLKRKVKEACLAIKLSRHWSRNRILAAYMNQVYYGNHAYGIEAAAQTYFSRHARGLTLAQAALLAGLPQAPSIYDPFHRPAQARFRRAEVVRALYANGDITGQQEQRVLAQRELHLRAGRLYTRIREPFFFSYVRDELLQQYGANTVRSGGLRVYTTIDPRLQRAAITAISQTLDRPDDPAAAIVSINPGTGAIRAMTAVTPGARGTQFNLAADARRQPGSTFKTFVLAAGIEQGINPQSTSYISAPFHYRPDPRTPAWDVQTYDHTYAGSISIAKATLRSDNTVFAQLTLDVGPEHVAEMAHRLGVRSPLAVVPAIGLGADVVSPLDLASAYATLAAGGVYSQPMAIRRVLFTNGKEDIDAGWGRPRRWRAVSDGVAYAVTRILEQNVMDGTGVGANFGRPAAGKTGTTDKHADAWFSGYTPGLEATVWMGYPRGEIPMEHVHGIAVVGGTFPATMWRLFMESAVGGSAPRDFAAPVHPATYRPFTKGQYAIQVAPPAPEVPSVPTATTGLAPPPAVPDASSTPVRIP